ncbi:MAG: CTP synthetase [Rhodobacteraceae bacterium]|nr:CTP synthetase [Paracoccaceae bacterium]
MSRLALVLFIFIGATVAGCLVVAALVLGHDSVAALLGAVGAGVVIAAAASWLAARRLIGT